MDVSHARVRVMALLGGAVLAVTVSSRAEDRSDPVAGRTLFTEARRLAAEGRYEEACPKFEESLRLYPGIGTLFNLADCWEHIGRTASAWTRFLDAAGQARAAGQPDREQAARERAAFLEPQLARLKVEVKATDPELEVRKDGVVLSKPLWNISVPTDPGEHVIEAFAPRRRRLRLELRLAAGRGELVVTVPELEPEPPPVVAEPTAEGRPMHRPTMDYGLHRDARRRATQRTIGIVAAGAGLSGVVAGIIFGVRAAKRSNDASELCKNFSERLGAYACRSDLEKAMHDDAVSDGKEARTLSIVSSAIGGAAMIAGGLLVWTARPRSTERGVRVAPAVMPSGAGLSLAGALP